MKLNNKQKGNESTALIFDFDGTLIDSSSTIMDSIQIVLSSYLGRELSAHEVLVNYHPDWRVLVANFGIDLNNKSLPKLISMWIEAAEKNIDEIKPFAFSYELLSVLNKHFDLYLWTGRDRNSTQYLLKAFDFNQFFINISCGDDQIGTKPTRQSFNKLVNKNYDKKLMIGDSILDLAGAQEIGMPFLAVTWCSGVNLLKLQEFGVKHFADNPHDAIKMIHKLMNHWSLPADFSANL